MAGHKQMSAHNFRQKRNNSRSRAHDGHVLSFYIRNPHENGTPKPCMQALLFAWWIGVAADSQENPFGRDPTIVLQNCHQKEEGPIPQGLRHLGFWDPPSFASKQAQGLCRPERSLYRRQPQPHRAPCAGPWVRSLGSTKMRSSSIERMRIKCLSTGATGKQREGVKPSKSG